MKLKKECFKVACVLFIMGNLRTPSIKHDYTTVDYWKALCRSDYIGEYNWCEYAMNYLPDAITKAQ